MILEISKQLSFFVNVNSAHMCKVMYTNLISSTKKLSYVSKESSIFVSIIYGSWSRVSVKSVVAKGVIKMDYPSCDARHF